MRPGALLPGSEPNLPLTEINAASTFVILLVELVVVDIFFLDLAN